MLPLNLLVVSMVAFLTTTVCMAPVEEKEEVEVEVEEELSEEEEDDDDSQSHDKIDEGTGGVQQTTVAAAAAAAGAERGSGLPSNGLDSSGSGGPKLGGGMSEGPAGGSAGGGPGAADSAGSSGSSPDVLSGVSAAQTHPAGNGVKLLNGGGGADSHAGLPVVTSLSPSGAPSSIGAGLSHLDFTGNNHHSSHDFLLGLMGHMTPSTYLDSSAIISGVSAAPSINDASGVGLDSPGHPNSAHKPGQVAPDSTHHSDISAHLSGPDGSSGPEQSLASAVSGSSPSADGVDSVDTNGNSRQTLLTDTMAATDSVLDLQTQLPSDPTGGAESVTRLHGDITASGLGRDVTESPVLLKTVAGDSFTHAPQTGVYYHTNLVTMASDSTRPDTVSPTGASLDYSHQAVTDHRQTAGPVTGQYNPSGQGPEGAENVELEDTC
ncbi:PE-PGRS family protein PE_PGRS30 isoform X2 [Takifugu flavidus]|uniref:PE-PGRS family protein PE_PGRS30 isoform X2 n=1 Tax=Takifugu flavidus TaxID=433684 RepID=UPI00254434DD|nr:PE-PGRS family protein PE_PGRS30 isoform X2 [Takifugu flavidus]